MDNINKVCDYGCGNAANFTFKSGKACCFEACTKCPEIRRKNKEKHKGTKPSHKTIMAATASKIGKKPWNYGLTKQNDLRIKSQAKKLSKSISSGDIKRNYTEATRRKLSDIAKLRGLGGITHGGGRGKKGWYKGYWCDSSWELAYVIYNLEHGIDFKRNLEKFQYIFENKTRNWTPDFIQGNRYVEIKGYKTKQVEAKLRDFKLPINLLMKDDLKEIFDYVNKKYGKDFIKLYETNGERAGR